MTTRLRNSRQREAALIDKEIRKLLGQLRHMQKRHYHTKPFKDVILHLEIARVHCRDKMHPVDAALAKA